MKRNRKFRCRLNSLLSFEQLEPRQLLATFTVTSNADSGPGTLRDAITQANNAVGAETVTFDATVFTGGDNSLIRLTSGELEITDTLTIDGSTGIGVTITGDANDDDVTDAANITYVAASFGGTVGAADDLLDDNSRVLNFSNSVGDLTLDSLTLTGGRTTGDDSSRLSGIFNGGGVRFRSGGFLHVARSMIGGNSTLGSNAGGGGIGLRFGTLLLDSSTVSGNSTAGDKAYGGGVFLIGVSLSMKHSSVIGNSTSGNNAFGGGIHTEVGDATLINSLVSLNRTSGDGAHGGGVVKTWNGELRLINTSVSGNSTSGAGANGGGVWTNSPVTILRNSTVSGNSTAGEGGGVSVFDFSPSRELTIDDSIVAKNTDGSGAPDVSTQADTVFELSNSLIGVADNLTIGSGENLIGSATAPLDPLLGPLVDNGGLTQSHALLPGSPAIDSGDPMFDVNGPDGIVDTDDDVLFDQRGPGFDRVLGGRVDIGAFEYSPNQTEPPTILLMRVDARGTLARPDSWETLAVTFDSDVSITAAALSLSNDPLGGVAVDLSEATFEYDTSTFTATWTFDPTDPLPAAFYTFTLDASLISANGFQLDGDRDGTGGDDLVGQHYVALPGDANLDGRVDVLGDAFALVGNLGTTLFAEWAGGDFNGDGAVDVLGDAFILVGHLGQSVIAAASSDNASLAAVDLQLKNVSQPPSNLIDPVPFGFATVATEEETEEAVDLSFATQRELEVAPSPQLAGDESRDVVFESEFTGPHSFWS